MTLEEYKALRAQGKTPQQIAAQANGTRSSKPLGGIVGGASRFLGIEEFGRGIATVGARETVRNVEAGQRSVVSAQDKVLRLIKEKQSRGEDTSRLMKTLQRTMTIDEANAIRDIGTDNLTNKQVLGSAAMTGLNIAIAGLPVGKGLGAKTAIGAGAGGAFGAANAVRENKAVLPAFVAGAALGGATAFVFGVAQKAIKGALEKGPQSLMAKTVRQTSADLAQETKGRRPVLAQQMVEKGVRGSDEKIINDGTTKLVKLEKDLQATLDRNKNTSIRTVDLVRSLDNMVKRKRNIFGQAGVESINEFKKNLMSRGDKISVIEANQLKRDIYKELSDATFNRETLSMGKEMLRTIASELRIQIVKAVPTAGRITKEQQFYIRLLDNMERRMRGVQKLNELGLSDTIFAATAIGSGEPTALAAGVAKRAIERTTARTTGALALDKLNKAIQQLPTDTAGKISKQVLLNVISKIAPNIGQ